jgi:hypothetical protein
MNVEIKEQSKQWMHTHIHQTSRKCLNKRCLPARKLTATVFLDNERVLMVESIQEGTTMSKVYCVTRKNLRRTIQNKRHGMLTDGVMLLHDNVRQHTAAHTRALLDHFNWELFDH